MDAYQHHGWRENDVCGTLTAGQNDTVRGDTPLVCFPVIANTLAARADGSPQPDKKSGANVVVQGVAYSFDSLASNSMKSSNPHSGCRAVEISKTLDTTNPDPSKNQGGIAVVQGVVSTCQNTGIGWWNESPIGQTLRTPCGGDSTMANVVIEALPFDTTQVTSPQNGNNPKWGDPCHPLAAQGHPPTAICKVQHVYENHSQDTRYKGPLNVSPMLPAQLGTGGNNTPFVVEENTPVYCLQGSMIGRADKNGPQGDGVNEGGSFTLNTIDRHAVAYSIGNGQMNQISMAEQCNTLDCMHDKQAVLIAHGVNCRAGIEYPEVYPTLQAKSTGGHSLNYSGALRVQYIVRRLTPTECARLQGFADLWGEIDPKDSFTDEEFQFWLDVRNTHAAINGREAKAYTVKQMLNWYNKLHTDSAEYKMWGNGIALPPALYCMQGITYALEGVSDEWML